LPKLGNEKIANEIFAFPMIDRLGRETGRQQIPTEKHPLGLFIRYGVKKLTVPTHIAM
jgi:hypothetical protein